MKEETKKICECIEDITNKLKEEENVEILVAFRHGDNATILKHCSPLFLIFLKNEVEGDLAETIGDAFNGLATAGKTMGTLH